MATKKGIDICTISSEAFARLRVPSSGEMIFGGSENEISICVILDSSNRSLVALEKNGLLKQNKR